MASLVAIVVHYFIEAGIVEPLGSIAITVATLQRLACIDLDIAVIMNTGLLCLVQD